MILNLVSRSPHVSERSPVQTPAPHSYFCFSLQLQPPFGSLASPLSQGCFQGSPTLCSGDGPTLDLILRFPASGWLSPPLFRPLLLLRRPSPFPSAAPPLYAPAPSPSFPAASLKARAGCCLVSRFLCRPPPLLRPRCSICVFVRCINIYRVIAGWLVGGVRWHDLHAQQSSVLCLAPSYSLYLVYSFFTLLPFPSVLGFALVKSFSFFAHVILIIMSTSFRRSSSKTVGLLKTSKGIGS